MNTYEERRRFLLKEYLFDINEQFQNKECMIRHIFDNLKMEIILNTSYSSCKRDVLEEKKDELLTKITNEMNDTTGYCQLVNSIEKVVKLTN